MRPDMWKVLVERPRWGHRHGYTRRALNERIAPDHLPRRESMSLGGTKSLSENLSPLVRFLGRHVGRPWDRVYSELCAHIGGGNPVKRHVLQHLFQYVHLHVDLVDGVPVSRDWRRHRLDGRWRWTFYVDPRTGLLRRPKVLPRPAKPRPDWLPGADADHLYRRIDGAWFEITLAPIAAMTVRDAVLGELVPSTTGGSWSDALAQLYGRRGVFGAAKRQLSRREAKRLGLGLGA